MRKTKEEWKTRHGVFDQFTDRNLFKLISEGHFEGLIGPLAVGKESNVFLARKGDRKLVVKIYRLENCDFNRMFDYLKFDPRYLLLKCGKRQVIFSWTQREYRNLLLAREAGVRVPTVYTCKHNIIVMEMIGHDAPAPQLKDQPPKEPERFAGETFAMMAKLRKAGMAHGDLSSFNILNWDEQPVFIDFSQASLEKNDRFTELLERDVRNMVIYFRKFGVDVDEAGVRKKVGI